MNAKRTLPGLVALALTIPAAAHGQGDSADDEAVDRELQKLGVDPASSGATQASSISIYGFSDLLVYQPLMASSNPWLQYFPRYNSLVVGNLNVYLAAQIAPRWRSLVEVRFLYAPRGSDVTQPDGSILRTATDLEDNAEKGRTIVWGGIQIERAQLEYDLTPWLSLRAGQFLTPYGIWNVDHGSPSLVGIQRPWIVRQQLFPEWQTGFEAFGRRIVGVLSVGYHLTLTKGRVVPDAVFGTSNDLAVGGRVFLEHRGEGDLRVGLSGYGGSFTRLQSRWVPTMNAGFALQEDLTTRYDERAVAADARYQRGGWLAQGEFVYNERAYTEPGRPLASGATERLSPDSRRWGAYGLLGYRTAWTIMPYVLLEFDHLSTGSYVSTPGRLPRVFSTFLGINVRPVPAVVLKLEYVHTIYPNHAPGSWGESDLDVLQAQASWAF